VAAQVVGALADFRVRMVSQAASRRNVTIVLREDDAAAAMRRLHEVFFERAGLPAAAESPSCVSC
jgi:aspartokinase